MKHRIEDYSHDLSSPDGSIESIQHISDISAEAIVVIENISPWFVGYEIDQDLLFFNGKSVLAQIGLNITGVEYNLNKTEGTARVRVRLEAFGAIGKEFLGLLGPPG